MDIAHLLTPAALAVFAQVVVIDVVLAGDNAIVVGSIAARLSPAERKKVIVLGVAAALVMRVGFALIATWMLGIVGLALAGGLLLLWVAWKMWRDLRTPHAHATQGPASSFGRAALQVAIADLSMSLDNVLAIAGAARDHPDIMVAGLILSVILMGVAANGIARIIGRFPWIAYVGLAVVVFVALKMVWDGWHDVHPHVVRMIG